MSYYYLIRHAACNEAIGIIESKHSWFSSHFGGVVVYESITKAEYGTYAVFGIHVVSSLENVISLVDLHMARRRRKRLSINKVQTS